MIKTATKENFYNCFTFLRDILKERKIDLKKKHIVLVPNKCSIHIERILFDKNEGAFDIEVLSFNRLAKRFLTSDTLPLKKEGAIMLVKKILDEKKSQLKVFKTAHKGLCEKLYSSICALRNNNIAPSDIKTSEDLAGLKLKDITLIYSEFNKKTENKFVDTIGAMQLLNKSLLKTSLEGLSFYLTGFTRFTEIEQEIVEKLKRGADNFISIEASEPKEKFGAIELFRSNSFTKRAMAAAEKIKQLVEREKKQLSQFCFLASEKNYDTLARVLTENKIPYYIDKPTSLRDFDLFKLIEGLYAISTRKDFRSTTLIEISKNYFFGLKQGEINAFEDYIIENGINFAGFLEPFSCEVAENARSKILRFVEYFSTQPKNEMVDFLGRFFEIVEAEKKVAELSEHLDYSPLLTKLSELAKTVDQVKTASPLPSFILGGEGVEVSLLPVHLNTVLIGEPSSFRGGKFSTIFALDFLEGELPKISNDSPIIAEREIALLEKSGFNFYPSVKDINIEAASEAIRLFNSSENLFLGYSTEGANRISPLFENIQKSNLGIIEYKFAREQIEVKPLEQAKIKNTSLLANTFFRDNKTSVSSVETYFKCPYKSFLKNSLFLKERQSIELKSVDFGLYLHKTAEQFVKNGDFSAPKTAMKKIAEGILKSEKFGFLEKKDPYLAKRASLEAVELSEKIAKSLTEGSFSNIGTEVIFGDKAEVEFNIAQRKIALKGSIDRVDAYGHFARVIDYKTGTGGIEFALNRLYMGLELQLALYSRVLQKRGYAIAGFFYFPLRSGFSINDKAVLLGAFDKELAPFFDASLKEKQYTSDIIYAKTTKEALLHKTNKYAYDSERLLATADYAYKVAENALKEIANGNIAPSPIDAECEYCEYFSACEWATFEKEKRKIASMDIAKKTIGGDKQ